MYRWWGMAVSAIINCWLGKWRPRANPTESSASLDIQLVEFALSDTIVITVAKNKIRETDATVFTRPTYKKFFLWFWFGQLSSQWFIWLCNIVSCVGQRLIWVALEMRKECCEVDLTDLNIKGRKMVDAIKPPKRMRWSVQSGDPSGALKSLCFKLIRLELNPQLNGPK